MECMRCAFLFSDESDGQHECKNLDISEEEIDAYFTEGKCGCPFLIEVDYKNHWR